VAAATTGVGLGAAVAGGSAVGCWKLLHPANPSPIKKRIIALNLMPSNLLFFDYLASAAGQNKIEA
jgi:hypothetical protein